MHASELAKNHPATNAGIFFGKNLGTAGAYALANSLPKWFSQKNQPLQVNPMSQDRAGKIIFGETPSQMASRAMNGYTPPPDYNFNLPDWRKSQSWQPQKSWEDKMHEKYSSLFGQVDEPFKNL